MLTAKEAVGLAGDAIEHRRLEQLKLRHEMDEEAKRKVAPMLEKIDKKIRCCASAGDFDCRFYTETIHANRQPAEDILAKTVALVSVELDKAGYSQTVSRLIDNGVNVFYKIHIDWSRPEL